jgi:hypothetical protein
MIGFGNAPISYNENSMMQYWAEQPSDVNGQNNAAVLFEKRYLYQLIYSRFKWALPSEWALNFFRFWLYRWGSIGVIYTREFGWICAPYSVSKLDLYWNPAEICVTNSKIRSPKYGKIGYNAEIIRLFDDYGGLDDLVKRYAVKLAQLDRCVDVNLMNSNMTAFFEAENKPQAETIKAAYAEATSGKPFVVTNTKVFRGKSPASTLMTSMGSNYLVNDYLQSRRTIVNEFLTKIGIQNANYDKKERLNTQEVNQNNEEVHAIIDVIYDNLSECVRKVNAISNLGLRVELKKEVDADDRAENNA